MKRFVILGFLALLVVDTAQQILAKVTGGRIGEFTFDPDWLLRLFSEPLLLVVLGLYLLAFVIYSWLLRHAPVGPSYLALHGYVVTTFLISMFAFGERFTLLQLCGCALIVGGIVLLAVTEEL
ncbi:MAG: EamA family transporter [Hyphomicrobiaceae bacterium]